MQSDEMYMKKAIALALRGRGKVNPNPLVGAVIVKNGKVIGEGYHERYGEAHAERNAVDNAKESVEGSTLYVTLEPCAHYGRQPPCVDLVIEKKFKRVVIGMEDPNPLVAGKSIKKLKAAGIEVTVGIKENQIRKMNEVFIKFITQSIPFVELKSAISLDGKIAAVSGESKWITSEKSRENGHYLRNKLSAIMVGINTVLKDNPSLTCRIPDGRNPIRVVVDSRLRIPLECNLIKNNNDGKTIVACCEQADKKKAEMLIQAGVKVIKIKSKEGKVDLKELMKILGKEKIDSVLIEGGGTLSFSALKEKIVDKVRFYIAPKLIGGVNSKSCIEGEGFYNLCDAVKLKDLTYRQIDNDLIVQGYIE